MTPTPKLAALVAACASALLAGVLLGRPELAAVGAALAAVLGWGRLGPAPRIDAVRVDAAPRRLLEGDDVEVRVEIRARGAARATVEMAPSARVGRATVGIACTPDAAALISLPAQRWGRAELGAPTVRAVDRAGLRVTVATAVGAGAVRVLPSREHLTALLDAAWTQPRAGTQVARERGEGSELAELRPMRPGDPHRRIAVRASARRGELVVADRHADRNADVVMLLDTFAELRRGADSTMGAAVRVAAALAEAHLDRMDRVAVVGFGGVMHWLPPTMGVAAAYRVIDALVDSEIITSWAEKDIALVPPRVLPAHSLVVAVSPLLDTRGIAALLDLRARGFDLTVFEIASEPYLAAPKSEEDAVARRISGLQRAALRSRLRRAGAAVATITDEIPLALAIEEVRQWRRFAAPAAPRA